jgi:hypothetical protein
MNTFIVYPFEILSLFLYSEAKVKVSIFKNRHKNVKP